MHTFEALQRLPSETQAIVLELLGHRALARLGEIRQLGFTEYRQQTRLQHTIESVELAAKLLEKAPATNSTVRNHLLAAIALEDVGRAPFSNSLDPLFSSVPGMSGTRPIDVDRSIAVIRHLEMAEGLLGRHGLSCSVVTSLLEGTTSWGGSQWTKDLIGGATDLDRLQYVAGDTQAAAGTPINIGAVARGMALDGGHEGTVVDQSSVEAILDFLLQRARLFMQIYYEPTKLATELIVRRFLADLWTFLEAEDVEGWRDIASPRSVEDFLRWTDATFLAALDGERWQSIPDSLRQRHLLMMDGGLQVAEVRQQGTALVRIAEIERLLSDASQELLAHEHCRIIAGPQLPALQAYQPGTIAVLLNGRYRDLSATHEVGTVPALIQTMRRCPLVVFQTKDFEAVQLIVRDAGLVMSEVRPIAGLRRFTDEGNRKGRIILD